MTINEQAADTNIVYDKFESYYTMSTRTFESLTIQDINDMQTYIMYNPCNKLLKIVDKHTGNILLIK